MIIVKNVNKIIKKRESIRRYFDNVFNFILSEREFKLINNIVFNVFFF